MRKGQNVYKRKDGRWEARIATGRTTDGKILYKSLYAPTCRQAVQLKKDYIVEPEVESPVSTGTSSFLELSQQWLSDNSISWKQSTYVKYQNCLDRYVLPAWGDKLVSEIDEDAYAELMTRLRGQLQDSSIHTVNTILKNCLAQVPDSLQIIPKRKRETGTVKQIETLTGTETTALIQACNGKKDTTSLGILIALFEGIRLGELCALKWNDIDIEEGILHIRHTLQRIRNLPGKAAHQKKTRIILDTPKNHKERIIPIHPQLKEWLASQKRLHPDADFILSGNPKPVEPRTYTARFKKFCKVSGLRDFKFHTIRHTFATRCVESGMDIKVLSEILGHSSVKITLDRYVHPSMDFKKSQISNLQM